MDISEVMQDICEVLFHIQQNHGKEKAEGVINGLSRVSFDAKHFARPEENVREFLQKMWKSTLKRTAFQSMLKYCR